MKKIIGLTIIIAVLGIGWYFLAPILIQPETKKEVTLEELTPETTTEKENPNVPPTFTEAAINFTHIYNHNKLAFAGGSLIDVNGDGVDEIFVGGGENQNDVLFSYKNGEFVDSSKNRNLSNDSTTYGSLSLDMNKDGQTDLVVARDNGLYLYMNANGIFTEKRLDVTFAEATVPLAITAADINKDGWTDLYVSTFVSSENFRAATFNDPMHAKPNLMLLNNQDNSFTDITDKSGIDLEQNTFLSVFVDLNNDTHSDLVIAPNTDTIRIFQNNGDTTFTEVKMDEEIGQYGFWMGLAVGDVDQDGDQDLFFSNIGTTIPVGAARGDLREEQVLNPEWVLLENKGDFVFEDATNAKKLTGYEFGWGTIFEDFNLNGKLDLVVMENYIKWPAHKLKKLPGRFFWQEEGGTFAPITAAAGVENRHYGMAPLASDFNQDGYPDLVYVNLEGPLRAFLNNGGKNHFLTIQLLDNAASLGARVTVTKSDGTTLHRQFITSTGLLSDQSSALTFGLGNETSVQSVNIEWPSGKTETIENPEIDTVLKI